jgi:hypothetical protein
MVRVGASTKGALLGLLCVLGCSENGAEGGMGGSRTADTTIDDWRDYCTATFSEDYEVLDRHGDPSFTAKAGDEYVVSWLELHSAGLLHLAAAGPLEFRVGETDGLWPAMTFSCTRGLTTSSWAVFTNATVFAEPERITPVCELVAGTTSPFGSSSSSGMTSGKLNDTYFYELRGNALGPNCEGVDVGYVEATSTRVFRSAELLSPVSVVLGPT